MSYRRTCKVLSRYITHVLPLFCLTFVSSTRRWTLWERNFTLSNASLPLPSPGNFTRKTFPMSFVFYSDMWPLVIGAITGRMKEGCKLFVKPMVVSTYLYHTWESGTPGLTVLASGHICFLFKFWNKGRSLKWSYGGCQTRLQRHEKSLLRFLLRYYSTGVNKMASPSIRDKKNRSLR